MADRKIDGVEYHVDHLPAVEAIQLYADILRILGPAASRLPAIILSLQAESEGQRYMADAAALAALSDILSRATSEELTDLLSRIVRVAKIKRPSGSYEDTDIDGDFTGRLGKLPALVKYVLEVQFSDFFPGKSQNGIIGLLTAVLRAPKSAG
ncbi:phage tail assembly chaperone [Agrobacterium larrymoorei]|uniref:phage tail assembly chaperone n=1 Tax=Agrobacterium larrymoorei TaxID=160699 RepID=UPI0030C0F95E